MKKIIVLTLLALCLSTTGYAYQTTFIKCHNNFGFMLSTASHDISQSHILNFYFSEQNTFRKLENAGESFGGEQQSIFGWVTDENGNKVPNLFYELTFLSDVQMNNPSTLILYKSESPYVTGFDEERDSMLVEISFNCNFTKL